MVLLNQVIIQKLIPSRVRDFLCGSGDDIIKRINIVWSTLVTRTIATIMVSLPFVIRSFFLWIQRSIPLGVFLSESSFAVSYSCISYVVYLLSTAVQFASRCWCHWQMPSVSNIIICYFTASGVLKGFDPLLNLVLDGTTEHLRGTCNIHYRLINICIA